MIKRIDRTTIINPGSVGRSKDIPVKASHAVWNDGDAGIKRVTYDISKTIEKILSTPLDIHIKSSLVTVLEHGT